MRRNPGIAPLALAAGLVVTACTDLLNEDPRGFTTTDTFYRTGADLNSATIAIYAAYRPGFGAFGGLHGFGNWTAPELASDQARHDNREPNYNTRSPDYIDWSPNTGQTGGYWGLMYGVITRANLVLANGPGIQTPNQQMKDWNLAEAKLLRGYAYLWLTKVYDGVPLLLTPEEQANPRPTRTPLEQVHQAIVQDLTEAEAALPETWPPNDGYGIPTQGRVTKGAAQMALADLYLWRSTYLVQDEWQLASDWAKKVIDSGTWDLNADYIRTFRPGNEGNSEMIFSLTNTGLEPRTSNVFQLFYYPRDWGLDLGQGGGWGLIHPTDWFWDSYLTGDYRRSTGIHHTTEAAYVTGGCGLSGDCGDNADSTLGDGPMPWKYKKSDGGATWWLGDVDVPLYRSAEAILIYAEAQNELGNTGEALTYLNLIRARARQGTGAENRPEPHDYGTAGEPVDQTSVREAIYMERAWELAFEAKRWFDLVRRDSREPGFWETSLETHDPNSLVAWSDLAGQEFRTRFPIPDGQIDANPALCQNAGYGGNECAPGSGIQP
ncbi:MAG: RagB/SusD family nutrient uptake outer membrane protein [Gemmatimonadales bacterium]